MAVIHQKKSLGQHFLQDQAILQGIVSGAQLQSTDHVLEIGPGSGNMTTLLAAQVSRLTAVEIDRSLEAILSVSLAPYPTAQVIYGDFLTMDLAVLRESLGDGPIKVVANLPYYITTAILEKLFLSSLPLESITVLIQKEMGERLLCPPGSKDYGVISVLAAYWGRGEAILDVPPQAFVPPPRVDSQVVHLIRRRDLKEKTADENLFYRLVKTAFLFRRKQIKNGLGSLGYPADKIAAAFHEAGIDSSRRAETLTVEEFITLANCLAR